MRKCTKTTVRAQAACACAKAVILICSRALRDALAARKRDGASHARLCAIRHGSCTCAGPSSSWACSFASSTGCSEGTMATSMRPKATVGLRMLLRGAPQALFCHPVFNSSQSKWHFVLRSDSQYHRALGVPPSGSNLSTRF